MYKFDIRNYNGGDCIETREFTTLSEIEQWLKESGQTSIVWLDFKNKVMWVTQYGRFGQR